MDYNDTDKLFKKKRRTNRKKDRNILYEKYKKNILMALFLLMIVIISLIIIVYFYKHKENQNNFSDNLTIDIINILPKLNLANNSFIPTKKQILESRELYINNKNLTPSYIRYFKTINEQEDLLYKKKEKEGKYFDNFFNFTRETQYNYLDYYNLCIHEKLLNPEKIQPCYDPFISIILPSYNKANDILKSIRSIQNQSFKKIEIIIVDDCSTDNSKQIYKKLLDSDPRIRVFYHQKNMGVWRSRLDGFLYSKSKYILHFDPGDFYADNYILEDCYNILSNYTLDSLRFSFREFYRKIDIKNPKNSREVKFPNEFLKIMYGMLDIPVDNVDFGSIWNRLTRAAIFTKGLYLLDEYILNAYKNLWEDRWWNQLANKISYSNLFINRVGYIYFRSFEGEGRVKVNTDERKFKVIKEFIYFLYFDYLIESKYSDKRKIINFFRSLTSNNYTYFYFKLNINYLNKNFQIFDYLITCLLNDPFVYEEDKNFLEELYKNHKKKLHETI